MNDFKKQLAYSLDVTRNEDFDRFYFEAFPRLQRVEHISFEEQPELQLQGIDKKLHFKNGYITTVDEKVRTKAYEDIFLEILSNRERKKPGALFTIKADYMTYFIEPTGKAYLIPMLPLRMAWENNYKVWRKEYPYRIAKNTNYTTMGIAIPTDTLFKAINKELQNHYKSTTGKGGQNGSI